MWKRIIWSGYLLLFFINPVFSQKANFQLAEKFAPGKIKKMAGSTSVRPHWLHKSNKFWYSYKTSDGTNFYLVDPEKKQKRLLFDNLYMATELIKLLEKPFNEKNLPIKNIKFKKNNDLFTFQIDSVKLKYILATRKVSIVDTLRKKEEKKKLVNQKWANFSPDSAYVAYAKNHNLFIMRNNDPDSVEIQLTQNGERWYSYAYDREDTSKTKKLRARARWFKDSKKLFVVRQDSRKVKELWVINSLKNPRPTLETYKYAMPGEEEVPQSELLIIDIDTTKKIVKIDTKKWIDQTIRAYPTAKKSDKIYFIRQDRTYSKIELCVADTRTGKSKMLISEVAKPYIYSPQVAILNEGKDIIWWSEKDGWGHFYLYDGNGHLKNRITQGNFVVDRITKIDTTGRTLYFPAYGREKGIDPYYTLYYRVEFDGKRMKLLTTENATHSLRTSSLELVKYFVDTYSRVDEVPKSVLRDRYGNVVLELSKTDISRLVEAGWKMPETFRVKADDGVTDLFGVMWKPFDLDPEKKYPIIAYCYPGPQTEPVPRSFSLSSNVALAQLGFIVVAVGNRGGSPKRSKYFHDWGYWNNRDYPLADNKYAIEQLADRYSFIDINKVGIYGHSGGGNMTAAAMFTYPDFYKVGVSSSGNHDNNIYNKWWGEIHYGVKVVEKKKEKKKKEDMKKSSEKKKGKKGKEEKIKFETKIKTNQEIAKNLKGHLLLVTGDIDNNVHPANTIRVVNALIKAGKRFDFMIMPGKRHGYGNYRKYFQRMMWRYFAQHLLGDYRTDVDIYLYENS